MLVIFKFKSQSGIEPGLFVQFVCADDDERALNHAIKVDERRMGQTKINIFFEILSLFYIPPKRARYEIVSDGTAVLLLLFIQYAVRQQRTYKKPGY